MQSLSLRRIFRLSFLLTILLGLSCSSSSKEETSETNEETTEETNQKYSISFTLTGLDGEIQISDGENTITFTEDGTYELLADLKKGTKFSYEWVTTPTYQNCEADILSGSIDDKDIEIAATCQDKSWHHPESLTDFLSTGSSDVDRSDIAMNSKGDILVAWLQRDSTGENRIFIAEYVNGKWTKPADKDDYIAYEASDGANTPVVALNENGDAFVLYLQTQTTYTRVHYSQKTDGSWSHPTSTLEQVLNPVDSEGFLPTIAMDNHGNAIVLWRGETDLGECEAGRSRCYQVFKAEFRDGTWDLPEDRYDYISFKSHLPNGDYSVAMNDAGEAVIAWGQYEGELPPSPPAECATFACSGDQLIYMAGYSEGAWTFPTGINKPFSPRGGDCRDEIALEMNESGDVLMVWVQENSSAFTRVFRAERVEGAWSKPSTNDDFFSPSDSVADSGEFSADLNDNGDAAIFWTDSYLPDGASESANIILYSEKKDGTWADPSSVDENISLPASEAANSQAGKVSLDTHGRVLLPWVETLLPDYEKVILLGDKIKGESIFPTSGNDRFSPTKENPDLYDANEPRALASDSGDAVVLWGQTVEDPDTPGTSGTYELFLSHYR